MPDRRKQDGSIDVIPVIVYTPEPSLASPGRMLREMYRDLSASGGLAFRLAVRDISAQYRQSYFGLLWAFLLPLANTIVWLFLSSSGVVRVSETGIPYPVFVFTGTVVWSVFVDAVNAPLTQNTAAKAMLAKLNFPREALLLSGIYTTLFNACIRIGILLLVLPFFGVPWATTLFLLPLALLSLMVVGTVLGLLITPAGMLYTDIAKGLPLLLQMLMYLTPVVFPMPEDGWGRIVLALNPLSPVIVTTRDWLTGSPAEHLLGFSAVTLFSLALLLILWAAYRLAMPILIERMSS